MNNTEKDRIMRRIKKCLALSKSDNEHEAATALRQAKRMMDKYGIDIADAKAPDYQVLDLSEGKLRNSRLTQAEKMLYGVVARFFGCTLYYAGGWPVLIGVAPAPKVAEYASSVLLRQMRRSYSLMLRDIESRIGGRLDTASKRKARHSYSLSWSAAVHAKVKEFAAAVMPEQERAHERAASKHFDIDTGAIKVKAKPVRGINQNCALSDYAVRSGQADGKKASLNMAMHSEYSPPARLEALKTGDCDEG